MEVGKGDSVGGKVIGVFILSTFLLICFYFGCRLVIVKFSVSN